MSQFCVISFKIQSFYEWIIIDDKVRGGTRSTSSRFDQRFVKYDRNKLTGQSRISPMPPALRRSCPKRSGLFLEFSGV